jgi:hypothetical protein
MSNHALASTRLGQLQRGTGAGFRGALADPEAARDDVLQCILRDPRADPQSESRARYYAELALQLSLPIESLVQAASSSEPDFAVVDVLAEMAARGSLELMALLADRTSSPDLRRHMVAYLRDYPAWSTAQLPLDAVSDLAAVLRDEDELVIDVDIYPDFWRPFAGRIAGVAEAFVRAEAEAAAERAALPVRPPDPATLSTSVLLDLLEEYASSEIHAQLAQRTSAEDRALLAWRVEHGSSARLFAAADALGRMGDPRLLDLAEQLFAEPDDLTDPTRMLDSVARGRRAALGRYFASLPPEQTLSLAREWWPRGGYFEIVAGRVLAQHAEAEDRTWLESVVRRQLATGPQLVSGDAMEALLRVADPHSVPLFVDVIVQTSSSFVRSLTLAGLSLGPSVDSARLLEDALWDCEAEARTIAMRSVAGGGALVQQRLRTLAKDPLEAGVLED